MNSGTPKLFKEQEHNPWLIFTDLTMGLFTVFIIAFISIVALKMEKEKELVEQNELFTKTTEEYERIKKERDALLAQTLKTSIEEGHVEINDGKIQIQEQILFSTGSADLIDKATEILRTVSIAMTKVINEDEMVMVSGHTDDVPINTSLYKSNWELSTSRATNVVRFILAHQFPPEKIFAAGYSKYHPIAPNDSEKNRKKNRRVEFKFISTKEK